MGKRKRISAAVHAEFSEYSSLLRALRTADTLDLSSHIFLHDATLSEHRASSPPASSSVPPTQPTSPARSKPRKPRDTWTRWPLLANDVHIPEFSFEEEMRLLAVQALEHRAPEFVDRMHITERSDPSKRSRSKRTKSVDFASSSDEEERKIAVSRITSRRPPSRRPSRPQTPAAVYAPPGELLSPAYLRALHQCSANRLSEILACLTAILPMRESSMQNRSGTINWEIVLGTVRSLGLIDQETFERLRDRMLALYANKPNYCGELFRMASI
ncbi:hypothetical protein K474DRAFT_1600673 [Panus rudis PR-1116 ss-1]|nr:hypothetical protein K474DRAFT_1600673 [Panus rudis PR-1116 ss-1]